MKARRALIVLLAALGATAMLLIGMIVAGTWDDAPKPTPTTTLGPAPSTGSAGPTSAPATTRPTTVSTTAPVETTTPPALRPRGRVGTRATTPPATTRPPTPAASPTTTEPVTDAGYATCEEMWQDYPLGVPRGHQAYDEKFDRDNNGWACDITD